jgi:hypothetical protein
VVARKKPRVAGKQRKSAGGLDSDVLAQATARIQAFRLLFRWFTRDGHVGFKGG